MWRGFESVGDVAGTVAVFLRDLPATGSQAVRDRCLAGIFQASSVPPLALYHACAFAVFCRNCCLLLIELFLRVVAHIASAGVDS